jgi:hypothetical protein
VQSLSLAFKALLPRLLSGMISGWMSVSRNTPLANTDPQQAQGLGRGISEDCLYLDIRTPALRCASCGPGEKRSFFMMIILVDV